MGLVAVFGAIGGFVNCLIAGELVLPQFDKKTRIWRLGLLGNVLVGSVAALVMWGMHGPLSNFDLVNGSVADMHATVSQLLASIVVGLGGGNILTQMAQRQAESITAESLRSALATEYKSPPIIPAPISSLIPATTSTSAPPAP